MLDETLTITVPLRQLFAPALFSVVLVVWTAGVYPFSAYGDNWAIWPAIIIFPVVVIWHGALVFKSRGNRKLAFLAALAHLGFFVPGWLLCLMLISKDSL
ncbi:hypothetical protein BJL95_05745 [Methylomonas sp. LWB]|uniref:hypothetical protein n=1 Tax=Methylomonas sp. LWB TaxID=1905845 RepID=UPI0008DA216D|nr:hypothetical protein [Methylomonas sp. LWB]OHX33996.1 hypothetical protein BJL95_05745 [Methylomonas sp. LWB]